MYKQGKGPSGSDVAPLAYRKYSDDYIGQEISAKAGRRGLSARFEMT